MIQARLSHRTDSLACCLFYGTVCKLYYKKPKNGGTTTGLFDFYGDGKTDFGEELIPDLHEKIIELKDALDDRLSAFAIGCRPRSLFIAM